jgi:hypothetical protein
VALSEKVLEQLECAVREIHLLAIQHEQVNRATPGAISPLKRLIIWQVSVAEDLNSTIKPAVDHKDKIRT